ncbi:hypothetical protein HYG81_03325 [Natrinema zhouii]|uniref:Uncharacterized protein n=1 Tax=Natrinema zhouii TaxID=1710539 RepID=A0A7D6GRL9_9EURY|nr:hypothetical protein [Natrinema zhouii]QLK26662.1 hypothetical protein HYG81_03325 [Natrinema zhouii]
MERQWTVEIVSRRRAFLVLTITALGLVFNYGTTVTTAADAVVFGGVYVVGGYLVFTVLSLLSNRFWWKQ